MNEQQQDFSLKRLEEKLAELTKRVDEAEQEDGRRLKTALLVLGGLVLTLLGFIVTNASSILAGRG
jgi:hypothetical protein